MKLLYPALLLTLIISAPVSTQAQHNCGAHDITESYLVNNGHSGDLVQAMQQVQRGPIPRGGGLTIPVVVHVVYNTAAENIPDQAIFDMITQLNEDYSATNSDVNTVRPVFQSDVANTGIQFCLADTDPTGNPTTGITRTFTSETWFDPDTETNDMKSAPDGISPWDPDDYLNVWVCDITSGAPGGFVTVGYAYLPTAGIPGSNIDGFVIDYDYGFQPGSRTATHEIGHYLGLLHPWGNNNTCASDDGFSDTPDTDGPTYSCANTSLVTCTSLVQYENFMDYATCDVMFTNQQAAEMVSILTGVRSSLLSSNGCSSSGSGPCIPTSAQGTQDGDFIDGVVLGSINNTGTGSTTGPTYNDYTSQSTTLDPGMTYTVDITSGNYQPDNYAAWIDYDQSGTFDASEKLGEFATTTLFETQSITFTVPASATPGTTVMRVRGVYHNTGEPIPTDPCFSYDFGETEDYGIDIMGATSGYCIPSSAQGTGDGDFIDGVVLGSINNTGSGGVGVPTYSNNTAQSTILQTGTSYGVSITSGVYQPDNYAAWIDYDQNGVFDASEKLGEFGTTTSYETQVINFTVPMGATSGMTVMRVRGVYHDTGEPDPTDPCFAYNYGETEDYGIEIIQNTSGYCIPNSAVGTADGDFIDDVILGSIANINTGGITGPSYNDYTSLSTVVVHNQPYDLTITSGSYTNDAYAAWIDYDMNGSFDTNEKLGEFNTTTASETQSINFTVPGTALVGPTVMRVRGVFHNLGEPSPTDPCFDYTYGETEDYTVIIDASTGVFNGNVDDITWYQDGQTLFIQGVPYGAQLTLFDAVGRLITQSRGTGNTLEIDASQVRSGVYMMQIQGRSVTRLYLD